MKILEARQYYNAQIKANREQKDAFVKHKKELEEKIKSTPNGKTIYADEGAILELSIKTIDKNQSEYEDYISKILEQCSATENMVSAKQEDEAMGEYYENLGKIMEVARRIMKGGIVPPTDEQKLMEYSMELYQAAKSMGAMAKQEEKEEYDTLWGNEEEKEYDDPEEVADNTEAIGEEPDIVDVEDTIDFKYN